LERGKWSQDFSRSLVTFFFLRVICQSCMRQIYNSLYPAYFYFTEKIIKANIIGKILCNVHKRSTYMYIWQCMYFAYAIENKDIYYINRSTSPTCSKLHNTTGLNDNCYIGHFIYYIALWILLTLNVQKLFLQSFNLIHDNNSKLKLIGIEIRILLALDSIHLWRYFKILRN
jgi:hypothetical protein